MAYKNPQYDEEPDDQQDKVTSDKDEGSATALLPKSILMGKDFEVGDEVVLKVTAIHDDEVQVEYATGKDEGGEKSEETPEEPMPEEDNALEPAPTEGGGNYD